MITIEKNAAPKVHLSQLKVKDTFECAGRYYIVAEHEYDEDETLTKFAVDLETGEVREGFNKNENLRSVNLTMKEIS